MIIAPCERSRASFLPAGDTVSFLGRQYAALRFWVRSVTRPIHPNLPSPHTLRTTPCHCHSPRRRPPFTNFAMSSATPPCESDADAPAWTAADAALLQAARAHDVITLQTLLASSSAQIQEPTTLTTPLHAAVSSLSATSSPSDVLAASETVRLLLFNGAIWNDIDAADDTPGCIAFRAGPTSRAVYELIVEAGVRAELLLARFAQLDSDDGDDDGDDNDDGPVDVNPQKYLASKLDYADDKLLDQDSNGVMMAWESEIMLKSVELLLPEDGAKKRRRVLNVGFGMGIVDTAFQRRIDEDSEHYIVEAHPDVLDKMRKDGWMGRKGVTVLEGRWQQV